MEYLRMKALVDEAKAEIAIARQHEQYADDAHMDIAIEATNIAQMKLNNLMKLAKLEYEEPVPVRKTFILVRGFSAIANVLGGVLKWLKSAVLEVIRDYGSRIRSSEVEETR